MMNSEELKGEYAWDLLLKSLKIMGWGFMIRADHDDDDVINGIIVGDADYLQQALDEMDPDVEMIIFNPKSENYDNA